MEEIFPEMLTAVHAGYKAQAGKDDELFSYQVELDAIVYHMGENDMCIHGYKKTAVERVASIIKQSRIDLESPHLKWLVSLQPPFPNENLSQIDVGAELRALAKSDANLTALIMADDFPLDRNMLMNAEGVMSLGELLASEVVSAIYPRSAN